MRLLLVRLLEWIWYRPNPLKWLLWPLSWVYRAVVRLRQVSYRVGLKSVTNLPVPVIIVGNITVGGTGKTPCVIWLARELTARGHQVGVVSRGYGGNGDWPQRVEPGSDPEMVGDEPVLIARATGCRVVVGPNRVAAAQGLLDHSAVDVTYPKLRRNGRLDGAPSANLVDKHIWENALEVKWDALALVGVHYGEPPVQELG